MFELGLICCMRVSIQCAKSDAPEIASLTKCVDPTIGISTPLLTDLAVHCLIARARCVRCKSRQHATPFCVTILVPRCLG